MVIKDSNICVFFYFYTKFVSLLYQHNNTQTH